VKSNRIAVLAALAVILLTASLGVWQLQRAAGKSAAQAVRDAALAEPPVRVGPDWPSAERLASRRVELAGRFEPAGTLLLDNRTHAGVAGFHVLTPLRLESGGRPVMVLRGWVARDVRDRTRPMPFGTPTGAVRVEGLALAELPQPIVLGGGEVDLSPGASIVQRFDLDAWRRARAPDAAPFLVRQISALDDGLVREWVQPGAGVDRHYGYAAQWFALSALTAVMAWRAAVRVRRQRGDDAT
jgi:cytochrome oxidase assembly protein ShyY1